MNPEVDAGARAAVVYPGLGHSIGASSGLPTQRPGRPSVRWSGNSNPGGRTKKPLSDPGRFRWFVSRGSTAFEIFRRGSLSGETDLGESCNSGRRMEPSTVFLIAD